jgi:hypothetical protein
MTDPTTTLPPKKRTAIASEGVVYYYHRPPPSKGISEATIGETTTATTTPPPPPPPQQQQPISLIPPSTRPRVEVPQYAGGAGASDVTSVTTCASPSEKEAPSSDDYLHRHSSNSEPRDRTSPAPWSRYGSPYDAQSEHDCRHKSSHVWRVLVHTPHLSPSWVFAVSLKPNRHT